MQAGPRPWPQAGCRLQQHGGRHGGRPDSGQPAGPRAPGRVAACAPPPHPGVQPPRTGSFSHKSQRMKIGVPPKCFFCVFSFSIFEVSQGPTAAACPQPRWTQVAGGLWIVVWVRPTPRLYLRRAGCLFGAIEASKPRIFEVLPPSQGAVAPEDLSDFCLGICQGSTNLPTWLSWLTYSNKLSFFVRFLCLLHFGNNVLTTQHKKLR